MHRIGKDRCEAICQAPKQNQKQNKTILLCNLKSVTRTITTLKKQNHLKQHGRSQRPIDSPGDHFYEILGWAQPFSCQALLY
jgi:hypothetical protein